LNKEKRKGKLPTHAASATTLKENTFTILAATSQSKDETTDTWLCHLGASNHLSPFVGDFTNLTTATNARIITADGRTHNAHACGNARIDVRLLDGSQHTIVLTRTLYVPTFRYSLVSELRLDDPGVKILVEKGVRRYEKEGKEIMVAIKKDGLWYVNHIVKEKAMSSFYKTSYEEKHKSLGHPSVIKDIYKDSLPLSTPTNFECDVCNNLTQKSQHSSPPSVSIKTNEPFDKVHSDLSRRISVPTLGRNEYYISFVDDYTRYCWISLLKSKDQASLAIENFWIHIQTQFGRTIKRLHTDN